ncbi:hypothetical protein [Pseudomonas phage vB_PaeM_PS119XW]|uniref:Virion structural protein n=1 Tax=Pseudomonas phage vB_PaeM_PS119XW TaxID=2601632 RepID=A0A5C1K7B8_9CAUD|nr:virion structural protein [Pseudomonas phage vB_PaeM_PS119XW]QEM41826.1 hypothetical protein [Pseudomonas phage vB_PaeM_PS119XW]BEG72734.1 hypothetical protein RVBP21_3620 [Pseudomonas phage BRkr]
MPTNAVKPFDANREYSGGQAKAQQRFTMRQGDPRVVELMVEYTNFPRRAVYWEFRKRVIDLALIKFSGNYNWFIRQDNNAMIADHNYAFLQDTVRFIATGKRRVNIHAWPMLLTAEPPAGVQLIEDRRDIAELFLSYNLSPNENDMLQEWLKKKGGFDDLMYTMNMLFGSVPEKINK